ncbi:MAG TPA: hypothetical protein VI653_11785 [Steroidobacteraceae bacterium]
MSIRVSRSKGRSILLWIVIVGFVISLAVVLWNGRGGGISWDSQLRAMNQLLAIYAPSLVVMLPFYIGEPTKNGGEANGPSTGILAICTLFTIVCAILPVYLLVAKPYIEDFLSSSEFLKTLAEIFSALAVSVYFTR